MSRFRIRGNPAGVDEEDSLQGTFNTLTKAILDEGNLEQCQTSVQHNATTQSIINYFAEGE